MKVENGIGWRLDLVRNCTHWQSSQIVAAKAEFIDLIAKTEFSAIPISVHLYLDRHTSQKYYENWLAGSGLVLNELITCSMIDIEGAETDSKKYLEYWYKSCSQFIRMQTRHLKAGQSEIPMCLMQYQHTANDSILPIYF